jgi:bifunctional DNA-binding transcriptional regulator/antitoxin component of YhaV-PrlF toxin-antitoxin module
MRPAELDTSGADSNDMASGTARSMGTFTANDSPALGLSPMRQAVTGARKATPPFGMEPSAKQGQSDAHGIVTALFLPAAASVSPPGPPPLPTLHRLPRGISMLYGMGRADASGRVTHHEILTALGWRPGDIVDLILADGAIVLRTSPSGQYQVPERPSIVIPAAIRRRYAIRPGSPVLLAAAPEFGAVIVYPASVLDDMMVAYHSVRAPGESNGHE